MNRSMFVDEKNDDEFHPRAMKLIRKRKNFIVIAEDEPYFMKAYALIRKQEKKTGRWSTQDEEIYQEVSTQHRLRFGNRIDKS